MRKFLSVPASIMPIPSICMIGLNLRVIMDSGIAAEKVIDLQELEFCLEKALQDITIMMFDCKSEIVPFESVPIIPPGLSATVGFGGKISGNISMHLSPESACAMAENMLGMEFETLDEIVADAMGEMVNMLAGGFKKYTCTHEELFKVSIPSIVYGADYCTHRPNNSEILLMGVKTGSSTYSVQLIFAQN